MSESFVEKDILKRSLLEIKKLKSELNCATSQKTTVSDIAIIGMGCRLPKQINSTDLLWKAFLDKLNVIDNIPTTRWPASDYFDPQIKKPGKMYVQKAGFLDDVDQFDPLFFNISPLEASNIDPQHRILLEVTWHALQDACLSLQDIRSQRVGIFIGMGSDDYAQMNMNLDHIENINTYSGLGTNRSIAAGRIAYFLGTHGPTVQVDTSCSSSLTAVHLAKQSLINQECDIAIAAGINLILSPLGLVARSQLGSLSPDCQCKPFDDSANGFIPGEGCGAIILKPISSATHDGEQIYATIAGSAINHDGPSSGLTAPSEKAQVDLINAAMSRANINVDDIDYIEAHGTGTKLGDPIEISALAKVFKNRKSKSPVYVGSAKSNFGHLEAAAGILSLIKTVLCLKNQMIVPSLNIKQLNTHIDWHQLPFSVVTQTQSISLKHAGVSSFGMNGSNAHVIVSSYQKQNFVQSTPPPLSLITLSAKSSVALKTYLHDYLTYFQQDQKEISDIVYSINLSQCFFKYRFSAIFSDKHELIRQLLSAQNDESYESSTIKPVSKITKNRIVYLFSGQGSQCAGMGKTLYDNFIIFRRMIDQCAEHINGELGMDIRSIMWGKNSELLSKTEYTQPALFIFEYALSSLWQSWGFKPSIVIGHSVGEYVAACVAGVMSLKDSLRLVTARAQLMQQLSGTGSMVAVLASEDDIFPYLTHHPQVCIAARNSQNNTVISGNNDSIDVITSQLEALGIICLRLRVSHAFHSPLMKPMVSAFQKIANTVEYKNPNIPLVSNITGKTIESTTIDAAYWVQHILSPVEFLSSIDHVWSQGYRDYLEIGPRPTLIPMGSDIIESTDEGVWLSGYSNTNALQHALLTLKQWFQRGYEIHWTDYYQGKQYQKVSLPPYPFDRKKYWSSIMPTKIHENPHISNDFQSIEKFITKTIANLLNIPLSHLADEVTLLELGIDSMMLVSFIKMIDEQYSVKLSIRQLFEELTTVNLIAQYIMEYCITENKKNTQIISSSNEQNNSTSSLHQKTDDLISFLAKFLCLTDDINVQSTFLEMGMDSMMLVSLINHVEEKFDVKLSIRQLFEELNSVEKLGAYLVESSNSALRRASRLKQVKVNSQSNASHNNNASVDVLMEEVHQIYKKLARIQSSEDNREAMSDITEPALSIDASFFHTTEDHVPSPEEKDLTLQTKAYLNEFIKKYNNKTSSSKSHAQQCRSSVCNNRRSSSGFRYETKELFYPIVADRSQGAKFKDIDGNEYVDLALGYGAHFFGHNPPFIKSAIQDQLNKGFHVGFEVDTTAKAAELLLKFTRMDRVLFCNSGTEAVMTAMRIARAATKRPKIVIFANAYHGHYDGTLALPVPYNGQSSQPGVHGVTPALVHDVIVLPFDKPSALKVINERSDEIAAVLVEPVQNRDPGLHAEDFLRQLRELTENKNILLIFDEVLVGFRIALSGAQGFFNIQADLAIYGKVIGGGMPIGVVAGKQSYMDRVDGGFWKYDDRTYPSLKPTYTAGTFCKHPLTMSSVLAVMTYFDKTGDQDHRILNHNIDLLKTDLNAFFEKESVPIRMVNFGSFFRFSLDGNLSFTFQPLDLDLFFYHLIFHGVYVWEGKTCFISTAHTPADLEFIKNAVFLSVRDMKKAGFWNGVAVKESMKKNINFMTVNALVENVTSSTHNMTHLTSSQHINPTISTPSFSLYYFGDYQAKYSKDKYKLLIDGAHFADTHGFEAIWTPERHFHSFGGFSPNPSLLSAALARETTHIHVRSSVVLPIHHPVRVAEEWAMIDNLSHGRAGVAFASGWHPNDFIFYPNNWHQKKEYMFDTISEIQELWRGNKITCQGGLPDPVDIRIFPQPMQKTLPIWITSLGNPEIFKKAGAIGANIMTNMIGQNINQLKDNIAIYRIARQNAGFNPDTGKISILLHTLVGEHYDDILEKAKRPFCNYLNSSVGLFQQMVKAQDLNVDFDKLSAEDRDYLLLKSYHRYVKTSALIGTPASCYSLVSSLKAIGVSEIACFVDFGVDPDIVYHSFDYLYELKKLCQPLVKNASINYQSISPIVIPKTEITDNKSCSPLSILNNEHEKNHDLTEDQQLLVLLADMSKEGSLAYNNSTTLKLSGDLIIDSLDFAVKEVVHRHSVLRATVSQDRSSLYYHDTIREQIIFCDISKSNNAEHSVLEYLDTISKMKFDIEQSLFRVNVIKLSEKEHLLTVTVHHIICDGVSVGIILQDIEYFYSSHAQKKSPELAEVMQYPSFSTWRNKNHNDESIMAQEKYWLEKLNHLGEPLQLPTDRPRPALKTYNGGRITRKVDKQLYSKLKALSREMNCTHFMILFSAYTILLHKISEQDKFSIGIAFAGRTLKNSDDLVGYCSTIYPVVSEISDGLTYIDYLAHLKNQLLDIYDHQDYPFARLIKKSSAMKDKSRSYFFSVAFNWDKVVVPSMHNLSVEHYPQSIVATEYDLMPNIMEVNDELIISWDYNSDLFNQETVETMSVAFDALLNQIHNNKNKLINHLSLLNQEQYKKIILDRNDNFSSTESDCELVMHDWITHAVKCYPDNVAVSYQSKELTYLQLDKLSNQYAHTIISSLHGKKQKCVGILMKTTLDTLPVVLGILKSGNIYVPINPDFPQTRIENIIENANLDIIITSSDDMHKIKSITCLCFVIDQDDFHLSSNTDKPSVYTSTHDTAYIIYTAGSTGTPKGVPIQHRSVINLIDFMQQELQLCDKDVMCSVANIATDMAVPDYFLPQTVGARIVMVDKEDRLNPDQLISIFTRRKVSVIQASPSLMTLLISSGWKGNKKMKIISGAEPLLTELASELLKRCGSLWNWYGPTETTVWSTFKKINEDDLRHSIVCIGQPIKNTSLYVLDKHFNPVPDNIPGELFIGGLGLSPGYLGREHLNKEKFIINPFSNQDINKLLYRTGDKVRFCKNGDVNYITRMDFQIKIRGNRVELGEIETVIKKHAAVDEAASCSYIINDQNKIVLYIKLNPRHKITTKKLFYYLKINLPDYMLPSHIEWFDNFKYTDNGKIDRSILPKTFHIKQPPLANMNASMSDMQKKIADIWEGQLKHHHFSLSDDFFMIGGNSLLLARIYSLLKDEFNITFSIMKLFKYSTISDIEQLIIADYETS